jgi:glycyl-tRNA synthetase beta chain
MSETLLVELFCEELPPKALKRLGDAFAEGVQRGLQKREMLDASSSAEPFATPRRLAVSITGVKAASEPRAVEVKLMPAAVALDASGKPTAALLKKLEASGLAGVDPASLRRRVDGKAEMLFADAKTPAVPLAKALQGALEEAIAGLPIPRMMSYQLADGETTVQFVRPAHGLVALHGTEVVAIEALGLKAGRTTHGHRFQGARDIELANAAAYETALEREGRVIASFTKRRDEIRRRLDDASRGIAKAFAPSEALLDEVTGLVEWPAVYVGAFEEEFLAVPQECLVLTMQQNQKYFPLVGDGGKLLARFLMVSNLRLDDPKNVVQGNERVVRPRLADARFFFETDKKVKLADRVPQLASIVYHNKLGTQRDRVDRLVKLAIAIQERLPRGAAGVEWAVRAAYLAKADLVTSMVGEFPELQGIMGRYYAEADNEEKSVARAIEQHYWPRFAGDQIPVADVSVAVALADKLLTLAGLFGIGQQPTGDKDPFALRRNALGVVRILVEGGFKLSLHDLVREAFGAFPRSIVNETAVELEAFIIERARGYLRDKGFSANEVEAVLSVNSESLYLVPKQLQAVRAFARLPEASSLAAANKRVANILRQATAKGESFGNVTRGDLREPAEMALFDQLSEVSKSAKPLFESGDYEGYLKSFAVLKNAVDAFFDGIMVMAEDLAVRSARLALLADLQREMNRVADIAKLE